MPFLNVNTNLSLPHSEQQDWLAEATAFVAQLTGKSESYVMIQLQMGASISFAGSTDPCAFVELKSIGLDETKTSKFARELCAFLEDSLKIPAERTFIEYTNAPRHMWGWNRKTF